MTQVTVKHTSLANKKKAMAHKMAKSVDSATTKDSSKYPKHGGQLKHGSGVTKGYAF